MSVAQTPLAYMYCPSRRPVQTYPQLTWLPNINQATMGLVTSVVGDAQHLAVYDASSTTIAKAGPVASVARSDYAGNGLIYSGYPGTTNATAVEYSIFGVAPLPGATMTGSYGTDVSMTPAIMEGLKAEMLDPTIDPKYTRGNRSGIFHYLTNVSIAQISDGTSNTYLCGEKYIDANHYLDGLDEGDDWCDYCGYDPDNVRFSASITGNYPYETAVADPNWLPKQDMPGYANTEIFGSAHAGMCNIAFCDGSVHQISYGISPTIHMELANRNDGQAIDASMY